MRKMKSLLATLGALLVGGVMICGNISNLNTLSNVFESNYEIAYKEVYQFQKLTHGGKNLEYSVKDKNGKRIELCNYAFLAENDAGYDVVVTERSGKGKATFSFTVKDKTVPYVKYNRNYKNVLVGTSTEIVIPIYFDNKDAKESLVLSSTLQYGDETIEYEGATFTPDKTGKYVLTTTVTDVAGNASTITYTYNAVENESMLNKVFHTDEEEGLVCLKDLISITTSYNTDKQYVRDGENGSTKLFFNGGHVNPRCALNYPLVSLENYEKIWFYVYNDSNMTLGFFFNMTTQHVELQPKQWTRVEFLTSGMQEIFTTNKNQFELADITGLQIFFHSVSTSEEILNTATIYMSGVYAE